MTTIASSSTVSSERSANLVRSAVGGLIGGMALAMFAMVVAAAGGTGFWAPVRGITSVIFGDSHYGGSFAFGSVATGAAIHMMNSVVLGALFAVVVAALLRHASRMTIWMAGAMYGLAVWLVMVVGVSQGLQGSGLFASAIPEWAWAVGHVVFGLMTAMVLTGRRKA